MPDYDPNWWKSKSATERYKGYTLEAWSDPLENLWEVKTYDKEHNVVGFAQFAGNWDFSDENYVKYGDYKRLIGLKGWNVQVAPEHRRQGIARAMYALAKKTWGLDIAAGWQTSQGAAFRKGIGEELIEAVLQGESPQALLDLFEFRQRPQSYYDQWLAQQGYLVPLVKSYWLKHGDSVPRLLYALDRWRLGGLFPHREPKQSQAVAKLFIDNTSTLRKISPPPSVPKLLYRGLRDLDELPKPGQESVYATKGPASWTENEDTARFYALGLGHGAILVAKGSDVINSGDLFLWPLSGRLGGLYGGLIGKGSEWAVWVKKPIPIVRWYRHSMESIEETEKPRHRGVWYHASTEPLTGPLRPLYLAPMSMASFHGQVVSRFKISPRAKWFDMSELRDDMMTVHASMDSIGYAPKEIEKLRKRGFDAVWDSEDYHRGYEQVFIVNPGVLTQVTNEQHMSGGTPVPKPPALKQRFAEVGLAKDKKGYFVYTHRARSSSYPSPEKIPLDKVKFIASTG